MICSHPQCTGDHDDKHSISGLCPMALDRRRERQRDWYNRKYTEMDERTYNELLFRHRRYKALARMAKRHAPKEQGG